MNKSVIDKIIITCFINVLPVAITYFLIRHLDILKYDYSVYDGVETTETLLGVWSTLLGFMITAVSILLTIGDSEYIAVFRKSKHYHTVMYTQVLTCLVMLVATIFSIVVICLNVWNKICLSLFVYLLFSTFIGLAFSIFFLFFMIFKSK